VSNKSDQAERRALAGSTATTTYHRQAQIDQELELGGRYREKETITGSERTTDYPRLPGGSPWSGDPVGIEPPLGVAIDEMEPTGTAAEIEASLGGSVVAAPAAIPGSEVAEVAPALVASSSTDVVETPRPVPSVEAQARLAEILPRLAVPAVPTKIKRREL
jgi:hypothetical protein